MVSRFLEVPLRLSSKLSSKKQEKEITKRAVTKTATTLIKYGAPEGSRTPNRSVRSRVLYPVELQAHERCAYSIESASNCQEKFRVLTFFLSSREMAETEGFEPSMELQTPYSLSRGAPSASRPRLQFQDAYHTDLPPSCKEKIHQLLKI